jgi:TetR/AcrR family transcriptional repressor of nem operon
MQKTTAHTHRSAQSMASLISATQRLMLRQGYAGTTIDQICAESGLSKGSLFHHFDSKEAICLAAIDAWAAQGMELYAQATRDPSQDPLTQLHALLDIMISFTTTRAEPCLCLVGMMAQELALTNTALCEVLSQHLQEWTMMVARLLNAAQRTHRPQVAFDPEQVAWLLNSIWQGSMLIAKTTRTPAIIVNNLELSRRCIANLFPPSSLVSGTSS